MESHVSRSAAGMYRSGSANRSREYDPSVNTARNPVHCRVDQMEMLRSCFDTERAGGFEVRHLRSIYRVALRALSMAQRIDHWPRPPLHHSRPQN
jgi:hypothetical protein